MEVEKDKRKRMTKGKEQYILTKIYLKLRITYSRTPHYMSFLSSCFKIYHSFMWYTLLSCALIFRKFLAKSKGML